MIRLHRSSGGLYEEPRESARGQSEKDQYSRNTAGHTPTAEMCQDRPPEASPISGLGRVSPDRMLDDHRRKAVAAIGDSDHRASLPSALLPSHAVTQTKPRRHLCGAQNLSQATNAGVTRMLKTNKLLCSNKATGPRVTSNLLQIFN